MISADPFEMSKLFEARSNVERQVTKTQLDMEKRVIWKGDRKVRVGRQLSLVMAASTQQTRKTISVAISENDSIERNVSE